MAGHDIARRGGIRQRYMKQQEGRGTQGREDKRLLGDQRHHGDQSDAQATVDQIEGGEHQARIETLAHDVQMQLAQHPGYQSLADLIGLFTHECTDGGQKKIAHGTGFRHGEQFLCVVVINNGAFVLRPFVMAKRPMKPKFR